MLEGYIPPWQRFQKVRARPTAGQPAWYKAGAGKYFREHSRFTLFVAEGDNRVELGGFDGRIGAENEADAGGDSHS